MKMTPCIFCLRGIRFAEKILLTNNLRACDSQNRVDSKISSVLLRYACQHGAPKLGTRNALAISALAGGCWSGREAWNGVDPGGKGENSRLPRARRVKAPLTVGFAVLQLALASQLGH